MERLCRRLQLRCFFAQFFPAAICALRLVGWQQVAWAIEPIPDVPFEQEYRQAFHLAASAAESDVRAIAVDGQGRAWIATMAGIRQLEAGRWQEPAGDRVDGPAFDVMFDVQGRGWAAAWNGLYEIRDQKLLRVPALTPPLAKVAQTGGAVWAAGPRGVWRLDRGTWRQFEGRWASTIHDLVVVGDDLWLATSVGLFQHRGNETSQRFSSDDLLSRNVRALALQQHGNGRQRLWVGSTGGLDLYEEGRRTANFSGDNGLPCSHVQSVCVDDHGTVWVGTKQGLARGTFRDGLPTWSWRHSLRWLPNDDVRDVAVHGDGAWIATAQGVAEIRRRRMTLADKAEHYQELLRARHVRPPGLVEKCLLAERGNLATFQPVDTDNDGSFTGMYVAAEAYRYAVTGAADAQRNAAEAYRALEFLQTVTGAEGFVARTVIPADWTRMDDPNHEYTPQENAVIWLEEPDWKPVNVRWRKSADGKWLWKGDTSSDEITGHYLAFAVYYDLVADAAEKRRVAAHVRRITDHLIAGGFDLRDQDGQPTRWGIWSPKRLNDDPDWWIERGVNSVEMLSYLQTALHITQDQKYAAAMQSLIDEHHYARNGLTPQNEDPATFTHIDSELLAHAFPALLAYEPPGPRRELFLRGVERWFQLNRRDHSPYYNFVYAAIHRDATRLDFDQTACVNYLRDVPLDMVQWTVDHRQREDIRIVRRPMVERLQVDRLLPPSERALLKWDANPYDAVAGEEGRTENCATYWLLPYWLGRYEKLIGPPQAE